MEIGTVNCVIDFYENVVGIFYCLKKTMENMQLDQKKASCCSADRANCAVLKANMQQHPHTE